MTDIRIEAISGAGGKSAACFLAVVNGARFLLDLGEGPAPGQFPDLSTVGKVDAVLVSHGHNDHIGGLNLVEQIGNPPIYATAMTRAFAGHPALLTARELPLTGSIEIAGTTIETGRAGHAAGGVWMRLGGDAGILYTGDICRESVLYPVDPPPRAATLICDASYGTYDDSIDLAVTALIDLARRGPLLLPLPPTGRGVEIAVLLHEAGLPIALCDKHREAVRQMIDAAPNTLVKDGATRLRAMLAAADTLDKSSPARGVMIAANAAGTAGLARDLLPSMATNSSVTILVTGHADEETPVHTLLDSGRAQFLRWNVHPRLQDLIWLDELARPTHRLLAFCPSHVAAEIERQLLAASAMRRQ